MKVVSITDITCIELKCKLSEIFTPKPDFVLVAAIIKIKKTQ